MGAENATASLQRYLRKHQPSFILSAGFAGGLDPHLAVGTTVFSRCGTLDHPLLKPLQSLSVNEATFLSHDQVLATAKEKHCFRQETQRDAVEMESQALASVAHNFQIPCLTLRVISDAADEDLPLDFNRLMTPDKRIHFPKLFLALARNPTKVPALINFNREIARCATALADVISKALPRTPIHPSS